MCNLSKKLVLLSFCFALFQSNSSRVIRVQASSSASSSLSNNRAPPKWQDTVPTNSNILDSSLLNAGGDQDGASDLEQNDKQNELQNMDDALSSTKLNTNEASASEKRLEMEPSHSKDGRLISSSSVGSSDTLRVPADGNNGDTRASDSIQELDSSLHEDLGEDGTVGMAPMQENRAEEVDSIEDRPTSSSVVGSDAALSDSESEWSSSEEDEEVMAKGISTDEDLAGITVDVTTVKEEHLNINVPHEIEMSEASDKDNVATVTVDNAEHEEVTVKAESNESSRQTRSLPDEESESESETLEDGDEAIIAVGQGGGAQVSLDQKVIEQESESESDETEDYVATSEVDSDAEAETTSDWSENDSIASDVNDERDFVKNVVVTTPPPPRKPSQAASSRMAKTNDARMSPRTASVPNAPRAKRKKGGKLGPSRQYGSPDGMDPSSQPLKTLEKLQHMLDETDYMTEARGARSVGKRRVPPPPVPLQTNPVLLHDAASRKHEKSNGSPPIPQSDPGQGETDAQIQASDKLWTSKDRTKYKKQQQRARRIKQEQKRLQEQLRSPPVHPNSSDDEDTDDTDDGLGYTLPNLPVFFSDTEGTTTDLTDVDHPSTLHQSGQLQRPLQQNPPPPFEQRAPYPYQPPPGYYPSNVHPLPDQNNIGQTSYYPPNPYGYGPYSPQYNQQQQIASQYAAWAAASASLPPYNAGRTPYRRQFTPPTGTGASSLAIEPSKKEPEGSKLHDPKPTVSHPEKVSQIAASVQSTTAVVPPPYPDAKSFQVSPPYQIAPMANVGSSSSLAEASSNLSFDSIQKMSVLAIGIALLCYSGVSPRNLPPVEYNAKFYDNIKLVSLMMIAPILSLLLVFDPKENDINNDVNAFYVAFTVGYGVTFLLQILFTTAIRLGVFAWLEPDVFQLTPKVPSLVLPWVLRENRYRPKRITLFAADFATSCVACPIIEEYVKLKILQWSARLPRNFKWTTKTSSKNKRKKRRVAEAISRQPGESEVTNINAYASQMLAVSLGIKLCDSTRRILMYTKDSDENKGFYALCRGIFPIQELCGTMTALALAKRDVLGWNMPLWKLLAPAVVIHGMANFRGMKPIFKWNSATPWSEMQLLPWNAADDSTLPQLMNKGFAKLMWLIILGRVLGYCIKNYYLIRRQAVKRTTTYAGNRAAFSAELAATEMLKKTAKDK